MSIGGNDPGLGGGGRRHGIRTAGVAAPSARAASGALSGRWLRVDVPALDADGLRLRLAEIGRAESQLAAAKADTLNALAAREGEAAAGHTAAQALSVSVRSARSDVKTAAALSELTATRDGLVSGAVPAGHAQMITSAAGDVPVNEQYLVGRAKRESHDEFRRTVARHVADRSGDDGASLLERQRSQPAARVFTNRDTGMTVVNGQFDPITGARIAAAVDAATSRMFCSTDPKANEGPEAQVTPAQHTADAIAKLICEPDAARPAGTSLVLVADYDAVNQQLANARLANGTPVPISEIAKIAVDAGILPTIFDKATGDLRMGRRRRSANELQRSALAVRDQGCVGCGTAPEQCSAHHIVEWQHGGNTDLDNLVSVCHRCHQHNIHQHGFTVERNPNTGRYQLQPPDIPPPDTVLPEKPKPAKQTSAAQPAKRASAARRPSPATPSTERPATKQPPREPPAGPPANTGTTADAASRAPPA
ncbi:HNH endonuclease [Candidatus Poriferisodalis sp.]|uniref:HNH endonuclease n=1 Tax=Candidatus Poriferisodalis sp. TaxID=3101277 RepID=UPI003B01347C